jgi:hypothetical protein
MIERRRFAVKMKITPIWKWSGKEVSSGPTEVEVDDDSYEAAFGEALIETMQNARTIVAETSVTEIEFRVTFEK